MALVTRLLMSVRALLALTCGIACVRSTSNESENDSIYSEQIRQMQSADVDAEVNAALQRGDDRFIGVMGYSLMVPDLPQTLAERLVSDRDHRGVRVLPNTSDAIESDVHGRLQTAAQEYAKRYNQLRRVSPGSSPATTAPVR